jgi:hypothetical protein
MKMLMLRFMKIIISAGDDWSTADAAAVITQCSLKNTRLLVGVLP